MSTIPKSRQDLHQLIHKSYDKLDALLTKYGVALAELPATEDWTVKDVLAVRVWWLRQAAEWVRAGRRGEVPLVPAPGYGWNETPRLNNDIVKEQKAVEFTVLVSQLSQAHSDLVELIESLDDRELEEVGVFEWAGKWPVMRWLSISSARQFTSAASMIRKAARTLPKP